MTKIQTALGVGLVITGIVVGLLLSSVVSDSQLSGVYNQVAEQINGVCVGLNCTRTEGKLTVGDAGTAQTQDIWGTCSLIAPSFTVAASTTVSMDCAVTGARSGDWVLAQFATSSLAGNGWTITGSASTTNDYDTFRVTNWTGASAIIPASLASSTKYINRR